jgi:hypothetical protein
MEMVEKVWVWVRRERVKVRVLGEKEKDTIKRV